MTLKLSTALAFALSITSMSAAPSNLNIRQQQICNGKAVFCDRRYSNVSFIGAHGSPFNGTIMGIATDPSINQERSPTEQLNDGIRLLQGQTHLFTGDPNLHIQSKADPDLDDPTDDTKDVSRKSELDLVVNELSMCHTNCLLLYRGSLKNYLIEIKTWLDSHPNEVLTLLLTNGDNRPVTDFATVFKDSGIDSYAYTPPTSPNQLPIDQWPTYRELIASNKRLIVFLDAEAHEDQVPYILEEFKYFFETPFSTTDPKFPQCDLDRPKNGLPDGRMYIVNHVLNKELALNVVVPTPLQAEMTNAAMGEGSIAAQNDLCISNWGRKPNFVLVDWFSRGGVFAAQNALNGLGMGDQSSRPE